MGWLLPRLRADFALANRWPSALSHQDATIPDDIIVVGGDRDPVLSVPDVQGWTRHTTGAAVVHVLDGCGHAPEMSHLYHLAELLTETMASSWVETGVSAPFGSDTA